MDRLLTEGEGGAGLVQPRFGVKVHDKPHSVVGY
jgi:hypothetical protein